MQTSQYKDTLSTIKNHPIISFQRVTKRYSDEIVALDNLTISVARGDFVFLVGPTGSGKSTIVKLLIREELPTSGRIYVDGAELTRMRRRHIPMYRRKIGVVFQDFKLLPRLTAYENVAFALRVTGVHEKDIHSKVCDLLATVGLANKEQRYPHELSGGEQQRIAIARALVHNPRILVADEPTGNLDPATSWEIMQLLLKINANGTTVLVATHDREIVNLMRRRVIAINSGKLVKDTRFGSYDF
jgi:cell division transport system ATP-binding protein